MIIKRIWKEQPGKYFCISTKSRKGKWEDHFFKRSEFNKIKSFLENNRDKDLYWCCHGFSKPRRIKENAEIPKLLWADLDEVDPREIDIMPTVAWESSPGRFAACWVLDSFMTESLNRRMTYTTGADKGGWDLTQVLRVPGTLNYKYDSTPRVRLLWSDGPSHKRDEVEKNLPKEKKATRKTSSAIRIYRKYEKNMSAFARREILKGKATKGKRSEVFWKLVQECIEAGMTEDECFEILRDSPWNKFRARRDGDDQLKREIDKALSRHLEVSSTIVSVDDEEGEEEGDQYGDDDDGYEDGEEFEDYKFLSRSMDDVEEENIDWIWFPYIARGELTILEGDPGLGKSYLAQMVSKHIVDGERMPSVKRLKPVQGKVAYFDLENSAGSVTKKRLKHNGCKNFKDYYQEEEPFSVDDEDTMEQVFDAIDKMRPTLVVFDTLNTYIGKADTNNAASVTQSFKNFKEIATRYNCAVVVLRHLTKSSKERAIYRGQGSIAFTGLARVVMTVGQSPDDEAVRVLCVTKINVTRPPKALTYTIEGLPDKDGEQDRSRFHWGEFIDINSDELLTIAPSTMKATDKQEEADSFLKEMLDDGPMAYDSLRRAAEARGISNRQLYSAADRLGIKKKTKGKGKTKKSRWALPGEAD